MKISDFPVYSVSQVNQYVKHMMDSDELLSGLLVRGEISNYKCYPSGHHYFSMKDEAGSIRCVMFRGDAVRLRFRPSNGMKVVAFGRVSVFPRDGQYQLYCSDLLADGTGDWNAKFEALKAKLEAEGLFAPEHKKKIPAMPRRIALVTSPAGAAVRDMIRILEARWPMAEVLVVPVTVQGEGAAEEIAAALQRVNREKLADVIITGRGGGSTEDLWAFNEEIVARAIYASDIPVISAVGHEPDVTIADYVADLRASTPSNGAELAVPDQNEVYAALQQLVIRMERAQRTRLNNARRQLERLRGTRVLSNMRVPIEDKRLLLDFLQHRMSAAFKDGLAQQQNELARLSASLDALSPLKVLGRGYSIVRGESGVIASVKQVEPGDSVDVRVADGNLRCTVIKKEKSTNGRKKADI